GKFLEDNLTLWFKDTNGCVNTATTKQRINGNPVIELTEKTYCQDKGSASMDSSVIRPRTKFGTRQKWEVLETPGVDPSKVLSDMSGGAGTDWVLFFGDVTEDFYSGDYLLKFSVTDQVTGCFAVDTTWVHIVPEPTVKVSPPNSVCLNWDTMDLRDYILLNGSKPTVNSTNRFQIMEYRFDRNHPKVSSTKLDKGYLFNPGSGPGDWLIKFSSDETGCLKEDSFYIVVNDTPIATVLAPMTLCSSGPDLDLDTRVTNVNPSSATLAWSGVHVTGRYFRPTSRDSATIEGPYSMKLVVTDANNCQAHYSYPVSVRSAPQISITTTKPLQGCERDPYGVQSTNKYTNGVLWTKINGSDGFISNPSATNTTYQHGLQDSANRYAWLKVTSVAIANEVCPQVSDSIQIILHQYPDIDMSSPAEGCVPLTASFTGIERKGIPSGQLSWSWDFGSGITSTDQNPSNLVFPVQGKYTPRLTVTNTAGPCATTITRPDYVQAYPIPVANFVTDPPVGTTVALPKFKTENLSTLDKSVFTGGWMNYLWDFDDPITDPNDTSTMQNPRYAYGKDTNTYTISLRVTSDKGCVNTFSRNVLVGPDIIVFIPDVFTPDGAGVNRNNTFMITAQNYRTMNMTVYNRWGEKLYETDDITKGWDGTSNGVNCQQEVYVYHIEVISFEGKLYKFDGTVTLLR
ncbi:MAG: PKD domain-containing protein, partial [Bacteroidia bacterium]